MLKYSWFTGEYHKPIICHKCDKEICSDCLQCFNVKCVIDNCQCIKCETCLDSGVSWDHANLKDCTGLCEMWKR